MTRAGQKTSGRNPGCFLFLDFSPKILHNAGIPTTEIQEDFIKNLSNLHMAMCYNVIIPIVVKIMTFPEIPESD